MSTWLKQSTAATIVLGPFVDSTDGVTAETGLTISQADVRLSKNAAAFAQANESTSASHMENGYYSKPLNTTDTGTLGILIVAVNESGALPVWREFMVLPANVYDSLISASDNLQADVQEWRGSVPNALTSGRVESLVGAMAANVVTATAINADAITAAKIADGAIDAATFAAGAINAAAIAADAIGASELAGDAVTEIANAVADQVWEETLADHSGTSGSTAEALNAAGAAGDPWTTALPGAYGAGSAGNIIGNNLDAAVSSRASQASVDTIDGNVDSILADTDDIGVAGAGLTAIPWNASWDAEVQSEATDALNAYDPPTKAELDAAVAPLATSAALTTVDGVVDAIKVTTDKLDDTLEDDAGTFRFTTNALEQAPSGGGSAPTAAEVADEVRVELATELARIDVAISTRAAGGAGGVIGSGSTSHPVTVTQPDGITPVEGVAVWVSTDYANTNVVAGTLYTDTLGRINSTTGFMLDPGDYYLHRQHGDWNFTTPLAFTVT